METVSVRKEPSLAEAFSGDIAEFYTDLLGKDPAALDYYTRQGLQSLEDAFAIANIFHTNRNVEEASYFYGLAYRMHSGDPGHYPQAQALLQARLLCFLKAGKVVPAEELETLKRISTPYANYIGGISQAWRDADVDGGLRRIGNAFEEFHTGEEIDRLYLELALRASPPVFFAEKDPEQKSIPNKLFMFWDKNPPPEIQENIAFHEDLDGIEFRLFDYTEAAAWLYENYGREARDLFLAARHPAEAADFLRVHVIHAYGGWWIDADIRLRGEEAVDFLKSQSSRHSFFLTQNYVVHNDLYGAVAGSEILADCLLSLYRNSYLHRDLFIAYKTGPGIFNRALSRMIHRKLNDTPMTQTLDIHDSETFDRVIEQFNAPYKYAMPHWQAS